MYGPELVARLQAWHIASDALPTRHTARLLILPITEKYPFALVSLIGRRPDGRHVYSVSYARSASELYH